MLQYMAVLTPRPLAQTFTDSAHALDSVGPQPTPESLSEGGVLGLPGPDWLPACLTGA